MKNAEVQAVLDEARARGLHVDDADAKTFLGAKEMFAVDPKNQIARSVLLRYSRLLNTGVRVTGFDEFLLPEFSTTEELAAQEQSRAAYLAATGQEAHA